MRKRNKIKTLRKLKQSFYLEHSFSVLQCRICSSFLKLWRNAFGKLKISSHSDQVFYFSKALLLEFVKKATEPNNSESFGLVACQVNSKRKGCEKLKFPFKHFDIFVVHQLPFHNSLNKPLSRSFLSFRKSGLFSELQKGSWWKIKISKYLNGIF